MEIAFAEITLNPVKPIKAIGYAQQISPMFTVHDALKGHVLLIRQEKELYVLCALDLLFPTRNLHDRLLHRLSGHFPEDMVHLMLSGTHTHFAPNIYDPEYSLIVEDRLFSAVCSASFQEASLSCGFPSSNHQNGHES